MTFAKLPHGSVMSCVIGHPDEGEWRIDYSERGVTNELAWVKNEEQAINILKLFLLEAHKCL
jgi:hypothetical protein